MVAKRRDRKNRVLRNGESQRKDGRYVYKYVDCTGKVQFVYSWKLEKNDKIPQGKRSDLSLREKERLIQKDLNEHISPRGGEMTVLELVRKYVLQKTGVKHNTSANYRFVTNIIAGDDFGKRRIDKVRLSDAKEWFIKLQSTGRGYSTVHSVRGVVRPAFELAVDDNLIRKNPFAFQLSTVIVNDTVSRQALTRNQEHSFLKFIKEDKHFSRYYDGIYILFNTGLRISEFVGLTKEDIDFKHEKINVNHQLQRRRDMKYVIESTKTTSGTRQIPMTEEVCRCFKRILDNRKRPKIEPMIEGKVGFLFLDKNDMPTVALHWEKYFKHICNKYNKYQTEDIIKVTPHVCRHTFCTKMAKNGMNPKTLQYIMGHSDIGVTLNVYTHLKFEDAKLELDRVSNV